MIKVIPQLVVSDLSRTVSFYSDVLGFEVVRVVGRGDAHRAWLRKGAVEMVFSSRREAATDAPGPDAPGTAEAGEPALSLHFYVDDVERLFQHVQEHARETVDVVRTLQTTLFNEAEFAIRDVNEMVLWFSRPMPAPRTATLGTGRPDAVGRSHLRC